MTPPAQSVLERSHDQRRQFSLGGSHRVLQRFAAPGVRKPEVADRGTDSGQASPHFGLPTRFQQPRTTRLGVQYEL